MSCQNRPTEEQPVSSRPHLRFYHGLTKKHIVLDLHIDLRIACPYMMTHTISLCPHLDSSRRCRSLYPQSIANQQYTSRTHTRKRLKTIDVRLHTCFSTNGTADYEQRTVGEFPCSAVDSCPVNVQAA